MQHVNTRFRRRNTVREFTGAIGRAVVDDEHVRVGDGAEDTIHDLGGARAAEGPVLPALSDVVAVGRSATEYSFNPTVAPAR